MRQLRIVIIRQHNCWKLATSRDRWRGRRLTVDFRHGTYQPQSAFWVNSRHREL